jgi:adenine-specific DNA-methyltransferase
MVTKKGKPKPPTQVETLKHQDVRVNIPTTELRGFLKDEDPTPTLYPRDASLDPQLVWKGKDEQDAEDLAVPTVPIYIQEKIHPQVIIENVRNSAKQQEATPQLNLFNDFNGIEFEELIEFYQHTHHWTNRMILGDSLLVMNSLAEKEGLKGQLQCIYMDPPYGIKFGSNWQVSTRKRDVKDGKADDYTREPEVIKAFRDTWELGIHSYLTYLRDRLTVARELLTETGSIFVQIGDENVHLVRCLMDEVFGAENFCSVITVKKTGGLGSGLLKNVTDYIIWYSKNISSIKYRQIFFTKQQGVGHSTGARYDQVELPDGTRRALKSEERLSPELIPFGARTFRFDNLVSSGATPTCIFEFELYGQKFWPGGQRSWKTNTQGMSKLALANRVAITGASIQYVRFLDDFAAYEINNVWDDVAVSTDKIYIVQTPSSVVQRCLLMTTDPGDLVLDPTCGSGTTAYVAEQWGRRWITTDTSRVALSLARQRLMSAKFPYYLLADSKDGAEKEASLTGVLPSPGAHYDGDIRKGFVYERVPHVTLKSIANNPDIKEGMSREEIDAAIARHAETEVLYDKPYSYPEKQKIRVTGPFTVETLNPHRMLSAEVPTSQTEANGKREPKQGDFTTLVIDNLKKAGVQNGKKGERLKFDTLAPHAGTWIHATGDYIDAHGDCRRVAVSIGPEHGTVKPDHIREAAKEAVAGLGFDLLIVCAYAFDAYVSEEAKKYGRLTVLPTRINADLAMAEELLKKTGSGNLFMVFGEPDITIHTEPDGQLSVEIHGVDVYNPTTGEIRSDSTDEMACWFIDTQYNEESFFVRHAYFTGANNPYDKLKKALKAEIDEAAWQSLYTTRSMPFPKPQTGKFAVKVINHYGDEVLKVFQV